MRVGYSGRVSRRIDAWPLGKTRKEMRQEVSSMTRKILIKLLTLLFFVSLTISVSGSVFKQESAKTHLRWNFFTPKETLVVEKKGSIVLLKTLNSRFYEQSKQALDNLALNSRYIKNLRFLSPGNRNNVSTIHVELANPSVEFFSFYRDREKKYIIDFWKDQEEVDQKITEKVIKKNNLKVKKVAKVKKVTKKSSSIRRGPAQEKNKKPTNGSVARNKGFRDYRYGASFIWDYKGLDPALEKSLDIARKTPEHFYPIKNRNFEKNEKEAHIQLSINLYRKKKYGLMYKSIKLFQERYNEDLDLNEYLKANAILRDNIDKGNREPLKMAINVLINISKRTDNYDLKKAVMKYLIQYYMDNGESIEALKISKQFYVASKENFDYEESRYATETILYNLAKLNQIEKIQDVIKEKTVIKLVPSQIIAAYEMYAFHRLGNMQNVIKIYEERKNSFSKQILPSVLYNGAEAYFRLGQFEKSVQLFDNFLTQHSYHQKAERARLRIATAYEIMEKDVSKTLALYRNAINRSQSFDVTTEARVRYVGVRSVRKREVNNSDKEIRIFLQISPKRKLSKNLKKLLWLVRLRTFINDKNYKIALSYLSALPLTTLSPVERRVFDSDGAEVIYGLIMNSYQQANYPRMVRIWNQYKDKYVSKVANDPYMNFVVGQAYLKLGLYEGFDKIYTSFKALSKTPVRTFPVWVERIGINKKQDVILELAIVRNLRLNNLKLAESKLQELFKAKPNYSKIDYYQGLIGFKKKNYKAAIKSFEIFFSQQKKGTVFDPQDLADMMRFYTTSLYELNLLDKYSKVSRAILNDTKSYAPSNPFMKSLRERLEYLNVEILGGKGTAAAYLQLEPRIQGFLKEYPKSEFKGRVNYLLGLSFIKNKKNTEARKVLEELVRDNDVSSYVKELARSELSLLNIKEKTL